VDERSTVDENGPVSDGLKCDFSTYRMGREEINIKVRPDIKHVSNDIPAPIGSENTGLITEPCAACGEHQGH
jgi:hypothetical protein